MPASYFSVIPTLFNLIRIKMLSLYLMPDNFPSAALVTSQMFLVAEAI